MCMPSGDGGAGAMRSNQKKQQAAIKSATGQIDSAFAGYDDNFYKKRNQDYLNYAMPQVQRQFGEAQKAAGYKLAGQGLTKSSAAKQIGESLGVEKGVQTDNVTRMAMAQTNQLKQDVSRRKSELVAEANAANEPASVAQEALGAASAFQSPSFFQPLGRMFSDWASMYAARQNNNMYSPITQMANNATPAVAGGYGAGFMKPQMTVN